MSHQSNNHDNQSIEMQTIDRDQSFASLTSDNSNIRQKFTRAKTDPTKWKSNVINSIRRRRNVISKALVGAGDSVIRVQADNRFSRSKKNKDGKPNDIIIINVSGSRYETRLSTLENYPNTLLGNKHKRKYYLNHEKTEYFFDRHRACFEAILYYYQSNGRIRRPDYVPLDTFLEEISFFQLGPEAMTEINKFENISAVKRIDLPSGCWRRYIWFYLEYPQHSIFALILYFISMLITILSCIELSIETLPDYNTKWINICKTQDNITLSSSNTSVCSQLISSPFFIIQTICVSYFTLEFLLRLISAPSYYRFILSFLTWIDLGAIVPYFVFLSLALTKNEVNLITDSFIGLRLFRILRFLRLFKIYLIFRQLKSLRVLSSTLKESFIDCIIMIITLTIMAFLFGAATYFAEQDANGDTFDSIPKSIYWGIITMSGVGYGDMYPVTAPGRILACLCAFFGTAIISMLVSVLVERYKRVSNRKKYYPEQIIPEVDSSDSEHDEKQDFIRRNLSGIKKLSLIAQAAPPKSVSSDLLPTINTTYNGYNIPPSRIRFIISINGDDETDDKSIRQIGHALMEELKVTIRNNDDRINLKLITTEIDSLNDKMLSTNEIISVLDG